MHEAIVFLDIDGVLNDGVLNYMSKSMTIIPSRMELLNALVGMSGAQIVVTSSWRYMVLNDAMTVKGFENMLRTHGLIYRGDDQPPVVLDVTCPDEQIASRSDQIKQWLKENPTARYVVLEDTHLMPGLNHVMIRGKIGITMTDTRKAIRFLSESTAKGKTS